MFLIRDPVAAGIYYNADKNQLLKEVEGAFAHRDGPKTIKQKSVRAVISPHDKLHLSGHVSAWSYSRIGKSNYIIIGPNHEGLGATFAVMKEGLWKTPLGEVVVDTQNAKRLLEKSNVLGVDVTAHKTEHSIEMQLPFLQYMFGNDFKIIPISITNKFGDKNFVSSCKDIGRAIASLVKSEKENWTIVATTDFTRAEKKFVEKNDQKIIGSIKSLSEKKFSDTVNKNKSFICGYGAVIVAMSAAKALGAKKGELLKYATSYNVVPDTNEVAGYASIIIY